MKALILSGGTGTRLRPFTYSGAKQLIPVANKPVLFYIIEKIVEAEINQIGIIVGETHKEVKAAVGNGSKWNTHVTYIHQPNPLGLAHAVKTARDFIKDDDFVMILGDNLFEMNLEKLIQNFYLKNANASVLLYRKDDPSGFGVAVVENGKIIKLVEKPSDFISNLIITGVYVFDKNIFSAVERIKPSARGELEITDAIQNLMENGGIVTYELIKGWWKDTGKPKDILEANRLILRSMKTDYKAYKKSDSIYIGKVDIKNNTSIKSSIINGPVIIGPKSSIQNSYIGPYTSIGGNTNIINCSISNSIVFEGAVLENIKCKIAESIIGRNTIIEGQKSPEAPFSFLAGDHCKITI